MNDEWAECIANQLTELNKNLVETNKHLGKLAQHGIATWRKV
jgi:hypothetical protein